MRQRIIALLAGAALTVTATVIAQQGGGGRPAGSTFSTQYKINNSTFGGAGPGTAGQVLTSNGAGMAPSFQAAGGGTPGGMSTQVQFNDGGAFGGDAGLTYDKTMDVLSVGSVLGTTIISAPDLSASDDLAVGDDVTIGGDLAAFNGLSQFFDLDIFGTINLESDPGTSGQVLTSQGTGMPAHWTTAGGVTQTTGNFTASFTDAGTTTPTVVFNYVQTGSVVTLRATQSITAFTGDSANFQTAAGDLPVALRPAATITGGYVGCTDNGNAIACMFKLDADGTIHLCVVGQTTSPDFQQTGNCVNGNWTASGSRAAALATATSGSSTMTYQLN